MGRPEELRVVDPVLTEVARGYSNAEMVAELLFPVVNMDKEAGKVPHFGKEAFRIYNTERAMRAKSNRISPEGRTSIPVVLDEHDLEWPIDYREAEEDIFSQQEYGTTVVTEGIQLRREKTAADLAQNLATYPTGNKVTLSGTSQFTDYTNSDPIGVVETGKDAIRSKIGKRPNVAVMGPSTYKTLKHHPKLLARIQYAMKGIVTLDLMREILDIPRILVGEAIYESDAGTFTDVWADNFILAYVPQLDPDKRSKYQPSFGYTFRKKGKPEVDSYQESGGKLTLIRETDILLVKVVGSDAGYIINDTNG